MDLMHVLGGVWPTTGLGKKLCSVTPLSIPTALGEIRRKYAAAEEQGSQTTDPTTQQGMPETQDTKD
jgi:hypothetical protein